MSDGVVYYSIQLALFIKSGSIRTDELSYMINDKMKIGEFQPITFPDQPGLPVDAPRLLINTDDGYRLSMSKARIDFVCELPFGIGLNEASGYRDNISELIKILSSKGFIYSRVGLVKSWFINKKNSAQELCKLLLKPPADDVTDVSLSVTKRKFIAGYSCNSLFNLANGNHISGAPGMVWVRDVNTLMDEQHNISESILAGLVAAFDEEGSYESVTVFLEGQ